MSWYQTVAALLAIAAAFYPSIVGRYQTVRIILDNVPGKMIEVDQFAAKTIEFENVLRNCEDVIMVPEHKYAILSCDPGRDRWNTVLGIFITPNISGRLYHYDYTDTAGESNGLYPIELHQYDKVIHALGVELHKPTNTLFFVNHDADGPTIEVFQYQPQQHRAVLKRSISHPLLNAPNNLVALNENELYITNDHYFKPEYSRPLNLLETYLALPGGTVTYVNLATNAFRTVARAPFANGIVMFNATTLAVASTTFPGVYLYSVDAATHALTLQQTIRAGFFTDNLSMDGDGKLLIAGHPFPMALGTVARENHRYDFEGTGEGLDVKERPRAASGVAEWDGNAEGVLRLLYLGNEYGTSTTAVRDVREKIGIVAGLYEKGILVWRE
ncbi:calcium-dependent phosphotriesterase [Eremomyces bilateralis CBS 781.70]|uniref:Calcium-dependent phosphotriesterase n=1 Tax=Eremomyces bilateralis CBS 781.70 TaxID=1392243 RepID=A0A6G1G404_9PEZI|nr:calcium-dependent phosphotriesterase [Eremomyces bilateralis CBS 781.70]KAF1812748.1 calcium-dependent phosphotriesterase [Eremomyces bilateralis CBS 781.70]